ncbi:MAG: hypothetical protein L3J69_07560 [Desulfobacula sp.]|nr:hypothetical protein [Desulfobacula sp.]
MSDTIITKSKKVGREITLKKPKVLQANTLKELVEIIGESMAVSKIKAQLTIDFRATVRSMLESGDANNGQFTYTDQEIKSRNFNDWKPETRSRRTPEEKAAELLSKLTPDQLKVALELANKA